MKWSTTGIKTLRETPVDTVLPSHSLLVRGGYIKKLSSGLFTYGPFMVAAIKKFENIVRKELNKKGCVEILMPLVQPKEIWEQSNRWDLYDDLLQKMKNRLGQDFCLGPTHEEVISHYVKNNINSYRDLPFCLYQIQTKFRDEMRPRFGLMRAREFIMKDAYSFDLNEAEAKKSYQKLRSIYEAVFSQLGVSFRTVKADSGEIGGDQSEEFHILADHGEDELLVTNSTAFNKEICPLLEEPYQKLNYEDIPKPTQFATVGIKTIKQLAEFLKKDPKDLVKILFLFCEEYTTKNIAILLRGSDELNLYKVKKYLNLTKLPALLSVAEVKKISGASPGSCGPIGLNIPIYTDQGLNNSTCFITGANQDDYHIKNAVPERDFKVTGRGDFRYAKKGDKSIDNKELTSCRGIEVGHIFYLGDKYSKKMNIFYGDAEGKKQTVKMGCYGIGITRTIQAVVEQSHDKNGIIWPISIAPFVVHICLLGEDDNISKIADNIYQLLQQNGVDVFLDDRKEKPGVKFKDADLLGLPLRINIGKRDATQNLVEFVNRRTGIKKTHLVSDVLQKVLDFIKTN